MLFRPIHVTYTYLLILVFSLMGYVYSTSVFKIKDNWEYKSSLSVFLIL